MRIKGSLYITGTEARCGKSAICLGIIELLLRNIRADRIAFFRPLVSPNPETGEDSDIELIRRYFGLNIPYENSYAYNVEEADRMIANGLDDELMDGIMEKYKLLEEKYDFILCEGTDFESSSSTFEFDINAEIANNLGCPVLLVSGAKGKGPDQIIRVIEEAMGSILDKGCHLICTIVNRAVMEDKERMLCKIRERFGGKRPVFVIPDVPFLGNPRMKDIVSHMNARLLYGERLLQRHVNSFVVAAMLLPNFLERLEDDCLVITPGDRSDVIVACLSVISSLSMPNISGIMLTGGLIPEPAIKKLIQGYSDMIPIISVKENTFPAAVRVNNIHPVISPNDKEKIELALEVFESHVDEELLLDIIIKKRPEIVTPKMFEYKLIEWAKRKLMTIVLPEGEDDRILRASEMITRKGAARIILLGEPEEIKKKAGLLGIALKGIDIINPEEFPGLEEYAEQYYELRKHKKTSRDMALDIMTDRNFFGTMMVYMGEADGMVSGAMHTTADTIRPAFQIIRTKPGFSIVSSIFFMCLKDRVLVYGDCAVNPDPNAQELAEIAISSAETAIQFGIEPRVAMLSYSTGESGKGKDVDKVKEATRIAKEMVRERGLKIELDGPMQYDAAIDPEVAKMKMPGSRVAGRATVFIFPDLDTGNNTYKAVQRSAGAIAIGPILQGLKRPVNDLSRGCQIKDVINTIAITAIQAQDLR